MFVTITFHTFDHCFRRHGLQFRFYAFPKFSRGKKANRMPYIVISLNVRCRKVNIILKHNMHFLYMITLAPVWVCTQKMNFGRFQIGTMSLLIISIQRLCLLEVYWWIFERFSKSTYLYLSQGVPPDICTLRNRFYWWHASSSIRITCKAHSTRK